MSGNNNIYRILNYHNIDRKILKDYFMQNSALVKDDLNLRYQKSGLGGFLIDELAEKLASLQNKNYESIPQSDVDAALLVWEYMKGYPEYIWGDQGVKFWLSIMCRDYIVWRWVQKEGVNMNRVDPLNSRNRDRHAIIRLFWAAYLSNGEVKVLNTLLSKQDLAVQVLERAWSYTPNFTKYFVDNINRPLRLSIGKYRNVFSNSLIANLQDRHWIDAFNGDQIRQFVRLFYGFASIENFDEWNRENFDSTFAYTLKYCLDIFVNCKTYIENSNLDLQLSDSELIKKISELNSMPLNLDRWVNSLIQ